MDSQFVTCKIKRRRPRLKRLTVPVLVCRKCRAPKEASDFHPVKRDGMANCRDCRELIRGEQKIKKRDRQRKIKREVVDGYGGCCRACGEMRLEFLTIDYVFGRKNRDVYKEQEAKASSVDLLYLLKRLRFPQDRYRVLCFNCNLEEKRRRGR